MKPELVKAEFYVKIYHDKNNSNNITLLKGDITQVYNELTKWVIALEKLGNTTIQILETEVEWPKNQHTKKSLSQPGKS